MKRYLASLWVLSGLLPVIAFMFLPPFGRFVAFFLFVILDIAHSVSPIVLAWARKDVRQQVVRPQLNKFLLWPGLALGIALAIGVATQMGWTSYTPGYGSFVRITDWKNPFPLLVWAYSAWNIYHFAMQDFGVLRICTGRANRLLKMLGCLIGLPAFYFMMKGVSLFGFAQVPPMINAWWTGPLVFGMMSANHYIVDIGLSCRVIKRGWLFVIGVLLLGMIGFIWMIPTSNGIAAIAIPVLMSSRMGLGFVHFLYSKWVWQFRDPRVQATIGPAFVTI